MLQGQFAILRGLTHFSHLEMPKYIMMAWVILHNMLVEDEHANNEVEDFEYKQSMKAYIN